MASVGPWYASLNCPLTNEETRETSKEFQNMDQNPEKEK